MSLLPHQERVIQEKKDLDEKIERLTGFLRSDQSSAAPFNEVSLLLRQREAMREYSDILGKRIALFGAAA